jgi:hypothetical protein
LNQDLKHEIESMRRNQDGLYDTFPSENYRMMGLLFRCFLSLALFICGIVFPKMNAAIIPQNLKDIPVYISTNPSVEAFADFIDGMAN